MSIRPSVVSVGNFDGVHRGHQALLAAARSLASPANALVIAITFNRHPHTILAPQRVPPPLMDLTIRTACLIEAGADQIEWLTPEPRLLELSPEQFVDRVVELFRPVAWVEGPDFRFGKKRAGDMELLGKLGNRHGFEVRVVDPVQIALGDKTIVTASSSLIRWMLAAGRVADAHRLLGRPWAVRGSVVQGEQRGRKLGFPTANIDTGPLMLPADGIYAGRSNINGRHYDVALSIGTKPTFGDKPRTVEAYILDFAGDLYGQTLQVDLLRWLREQAVYVGVAPLIEQIHRDVRRIRQWAEAGLSNPLECIVQ